MGQAIAGPIVGTFPADLGADVIKIERLTEDVWRGHRCKLYGESFPPRAVQLQKTSLCVGVRTDDGLTRIHDGVKEQTPSSRTGRPVSSV
jgi:crotonobetainyl-CoA:carnitine CoA-transferase CaiB-like acyl-CoA transferase